MQPLIDTVLEVDTPEHLAFRTRIAGPARRMFAWLIDLFIRAILLMSSAKVVHTVFASVDLWGVGDAILFIGLFILDWFYFFLSEVFMGGQSPGKMVLGLRVVRANGLPLGWEASFLRNLIRAADLAIFPPSFLTLGPLVMAFDEKFRRLGDFAAGTIVVVEESVKVGKTKPLSPDAQILSTLPAVLSLDRRDLEALELFVHRAHVSRERQEELAAIVAPIYAERLGMPRPESPALFLASLWSRAQEPRRRVSP